MMSMASNGASGILDTQANLQDHLDIYLEGNNVRNDPLRNKPKYAGFFNFRAKDLICGDWKVVWGPCVYSKDNPGYATNAMYVAASASQKTYVVAIAATDPNSVNDWKIEDGDVMPGEMAKWPPIIPFNAVRHLPPDDPTVAYVSAGSATGISNLLTVMTSDDRTGKWDPVKPGPQLSLPQFLANQSPEGQTLIFTGHSLGGALSPTLAMYLQPELAKQGWKTIYVLPTAGATPGTAGFANLFTQTFPATSVGDGTAYTWNIDNVSARDIVPHAWDRLPAIVSPAVNDLYSSLFGFLASTSNDPMSLALGRIVFGAVEAAKVAKRVQDDRVDRGNTLLHTSAVERVLARLAALRLGRTRQQRQFPLSSRHGGSAAFQCGNPDDDHGPIRRRHPGHPYRPISDVLQRRPDRAHARSKKAARSVCQYAHDSAAGLKCFLANSAGVGEQFIPTPAEHLRRWIRRDLPACLPSPSVRNPLKKSGYSSGSNRFPFT
jgi:hypothetical protein